MRVFCTNYFINKFFLFQTLVWLRFIVESNYQRLELHLLNVNVWYTPITSRRNLMRTEHCESRANRILKCEFLQCHFRKIFSHSQRIFLAQKLQKFIFASVEKIGNFMRFFAKWKNKCEFLIFLQQKILCEYEIIKINRKQF